MAASTSWRLGVLKDGFGPYAAGDRIRVAVENGNVVYRRNGALLYESLAAPTYPLLVDTSFASNSTLGNAVIAGALQ